MLVRWFLLVVFLSFCDGNDPFSVVVPRTSVYALLGSSVTLPCSITPTLNAQRFEVLWYRPQQAHTPVLFYQDQKILENPKHPQYQGRVSLLGGLDKGDASLKLENIRLADKGEYICRVEKTDEGEEWYDEATVSLQVKVEGSAPVVSVSDVGGGQVNISCQSFGWTPEPSLSWTDRDGRNLKHLSTDMFTKDSEGLVSVSSWLLVSPSASDWLSCSVGFSDSSSERKESQVLLYTSTGLTGSEKEKTECREESWKEAFIVTLIFTLLGVVGVGVYCVLRQTGLIGSKRKKTEGREAENQTPESKVEMQPLLDPQTEDKPLQTVFTETQVLYQEEEQQLQPQTEDTPHQPESTGGNHDHNPHRNQTSSPPAGGSQYQEAAANQDSASSAGGDQGQSSEVNQNPASSAGGDQGQSPEVNHSLSSSAGGDQGPSPEVNHSLSSSAAGFQQVKGFKVNITIDPEETPHFFRITHGGKRVRCPHSKEDHENGECKIFTLCRESFSSGQQYWELKVGKKPNEKLSWFVGVATEEAERVHRIPLTPQNGFWVLCYEQEKGVYIGESATMPTPLPAVGDDLTVIGVFLDCDNHMLSFYNAETQSHIYTFTSVTLRTSLRPLISPGVRDTQPVHIF